MFIPLKFIGNPIKNIIEIPAIGKAKIGILLKQKNPFNAINIKNVIVRLVPEIIKDISISPMLNHCT
jgi:hypothetical protein